MKNKKIGIIDFNLSNLESVKAACKYAKIDYKVINKKDDIIKCHGLIFNNWISPLTIWITIKN